MSEIEHFKADDLEIEKVNPSNKKKEKVLTEKQQAFLKALGDPANRGDIRAAMDVAGYSKQTQPHEVLKNLADEVVEVANRLISGNAVKAVMGLVNVLDKPTTPGNKDVIAAAKELLDRAGVLKKGGDALGSGGIKVENAVFILPAKESVDTQRMIE